MNPPAGSGREKILTRDYLLLLGIEIMIATCSVMSMSTMVLYGAHIGLSATMAGAYSAVFAVFALIGRPFSGVLCDRMRRKSLLIAALAVYSVMPLSFLATDNLAAGFASRAVSGFSMALCTTVYSTMLTDIIPRERFTEGIGYFGISASVSGAVSAGVGLWLISRFGYDGMFIASALMGFCALICALPLSGRHNQKRPAAAGASVQAKGPGNAALRPLAQAFERKALFPTAMNMLMIFVQISVMQLLPVFALQRGQADIKVFYVASAIGVLIPRLLSAGIERAMRTTGFLLLGYPMLLLALTALQFIELNAAAVVVLALFYGFGYSAIGIAYKVSALSRAPAERRGVANSTFLLAGDIGYSAAPILWGWYVDAVGLSSLFYATSAIALFCLLLSLAAAQISALRGEPLFGGARSSGI